MWDMQQVAFSSLLEKTVALHFTSKSIEFSPVTHPGIYYLHFSEIKWSKGEALAYLHHTD